MADTIRQLKEFLEGFEDQDQVVIWQFYTLGDFYRDEDEGNLTQDDFLTVKEQFDRFNNWEPTYEEIAQELADLQAQKLLEGDK